MEADVDVDDLSAVTDCVDSFDNGGCPSGASSDNVGCLPPSLQLAMSVTHVPLLHYVSNRSAALMR